MPGSAARRADIPHPHTVVRLATSRLEIVAGHIDKRVVRNMGGCDYRCFLWWQRESRKVKMVHNTHPNEWPMSAIGPKRTSLVAPHMSAFGGKANMGKCILACAAILAAFHVGD